MTKSSSATPGLSVGAVRTAIHSTKSNSENYYKLSMIHLKITNKITRIILEKRKTRIKTNRTSIYRWITVID